MLFNCFRPLIEVEGPAVGHSDDLRVRGESPAVHRTASDHHGLSGVIWNIILYIIWNNGNLGTDQ